MRNPIARERHYDGNDEMARAVTTHNTDVLKEIIKDKSFDSFAKEAYNSKEGYAIRINPITGDREMFVAGSRSAGDWLSNLIETGNSLILDSELRHPYEALVDDVQEVLPFDIKTNAMSRGTSWRRQASVKYTKIAKQQGIATVYGHSRGGAIVADMDTQATKVGLDAASLIGDSKDTLNIRENRWFDHLIGVTNKNDEVWEKSSFHKVWE